jgi:hypothetical protein
MRFEQISQEDLLHKTMEVWQPYFTETLNSSDAEEIISRWSSFITLAGQSLSLRDAVVSY